jgi:hypothetical protein
MITLLCVWDGGTLWRRHGWHILLGLRLYLLSHDVLHN